MSEPQYAKLFKTGRSQAVRLPKEFRFEGESVRIRRVGDGVLLEPVRFDVRRIFQEIDDLGVTFEPGWRQQPETPSQDFDF